MGATKFGVLSKITTFIEIGSASKIYKSVRRGLCDPRPHGCATLEEIADETGVTAKTADNQIGEFVNLEALPNLQKVCAW